VIELKKCITMEKKKVFKVSLVFVIIFCYLLSIKGLVIIILLPLMLPLLVYYICKERKKSYKLFFPVIYALFLLEGILMIFFYKFDFTTFKDNLWLFSICGAVLIISIIIYGSYLINGRYKEFPWS